MKSQIKMINGNPTLLVDGKPYHAVGVLCPFPGTVRTEYNKKTSGQAKA